MVATLNDMTVIVNNEQIAYVGDTLKSSDGIGEYVVTNNVVGGGQTETVTAKKLDSKFGKVSFEMSTTEDNIKLVRSWKLNFDQNVVELVGPVGSNINKVFTDATIINEPEFDYATEGRIVVEFNTAPAV